MRILILGAGLIGISTAWHLAADGHEVIVLDRRDAPAQETSFANGGQISTSHAEPWANPAAPAKVLKWLGREDAPLLWRWRVDGAQWIWGLRFLRECLPARTRQNIGAILRLALMSRERLRGLRAELDLRYEQRSCGILHIYTDPAEFEHAIPQAALMREFGCEREVKSAAECLTIEPALAASRLPIVGGTYTALDESGDAHLFVAALAGHCQQRGVQLRYRATIEALTMDQGRVTGVRLTGGEMVHADAVIVALGSYSPRLLAPLGLSIAVYPAKGYSITVPLAPGSVAPSVSLTDDGAKIVFSRLGERLRVAGTAEFTGYDNTINRTRCEALVSRTRALFPDLSPAGDIVYWAGLRPATPGNVPLIGATRLPGLWLNTGHGTLGWTMACGSGLLLADLVAGRAPAIDPAPYAPTASGL